MNRIDAQIIISQRLKFFLVYKESMKNLCKMITVNNYTIEITALIGSTAQTLTFKPTLTLDKLDLVICLKFILRLTVVCRLLCSIACHLNFFTFFLNSCQLAMLILMTTTTASTHRCINHHKLIYKVNNWFMNTHVKQHMQFTPSVKAYTSQTYPVQCYSKKSIFI